MTKEIKIPKYIQLSCKDELSKEKLIKWIRCVKNNIASGIVATIQTTDDKGALKNVCLVHKEMTKRHVYQIPLTRDILENEVQLVVDEFAKQEPDLDFDIETNDTKLTAVERSSISIEDQQHIAICMAMAKSRHEKWMKERLDDGWRFGIIFSTKDKTHPLLRPWEQLPDKFKQPDLESPQAVIDLINANGFAIIANNELNRLK